MMDMVLIGAILIGGYYIITHPEVLGGQPVDATTEGGTTYEDVYDQAPVAPTETTCPDGNVVTPPAVCPEDGKDDNTLDAESCQNYLQSGEPDALPVL